MKLGKRGPVLLSVLLHSMLVAGVYWSGAWLNAGLKNSHHETAQSLLTLHDKNFPSQEVINIIPELTALPDEEYEREIDPAQEFAWLRENIQIESYDFFEMTAEELEIVSLQGRLPVKPKPESQTVPPPQAAAETVPPSPQKKSIPPPPDREEGEFTPIKIVKYEKPKYPTIARRKGWEGSAVIEIRVDQDGKLLQASIVSKSGKSVLDDAALNALKQCRYAPAQRNGKAVTASKRITVTFLLD